MRRKLYGERGEEQLLVPRDAVLVDGARDSYIIWVRLKVRHLEKMRQAVGSKLTALRICKILLRWITNNAANDTRQHMLEGKM